MKALAIDYAAAGVLLQLYSHASSDIVHSHTVEKLSDLLCQTLDEHFEVERTKKLVNLLERYGVGQFFDDPFADPLFRVSDDSIREFFQNRLSSSDLYARSWNIGLDWIKTAYTKEVFWKEFDREGLDLAVLLTPSELGPFQISHNSDAYREVDQLLGELIGDLSKVNDVGNMTPADVGIAKQDLVDIKEDLASGSVLMPSFGNRARETLTWIAKEAGGAVVGGTALLLLSLIFKLFVLPF